MTPAAGILDSDLISADAQWVITPMPDKSSLEVRAAATGAVALQLHPELGMDFGAAELVEGILITQQVSDYTPYSLISGFDVKRGKKLWQVEHPRPPDGPTIYAELVATSNDVALRTGDGRRLIGLDVRTGDTRWQARLPAGCSDGEAAAGDYAGFLLACGSSQRLVAVQLTTGKTMWERELPAETSGRGVSGLGAHGRYLSVDSAAATQVFGPAGTLVARRASHGVVLDLDPLVLIDFFDDDSEQHLAEVIDPRTKRVSWRLPGGTKRGPPAAVSDAGWILYPAVLEEHGEFRPSFVQVASPGGKVSDPSPLPVFNASFVATAGNLLLATYPSPSGSRLGVFRADGRGVAPYTYGGIQPRSWPDACELLTDEVLGTLGGRWTRVPRSGRCDAVPVDASTSGAASLTVGSGG